MKAVKRTVKWQRGIFFILLIAAINAHGTIITVPGNFSTIQSAINASVDGDTVAVAPGTYFENINFRGKKILLTSLFYLAADTTYISSTIINGSTPVNPDTASCVIFNSGEDSTAILQGLTITGGTGTKWLDIHGAGIYREGGGILIELCSPTIRCNIIRNNFATNTTGVVGAGGGGIRIGDGNPVIENNLIINNEARYGPGIVMNYTGGIIRNNIIASNTGGQNYYGGSAIWIYNNLGTTPKIIVNNTMVNNYSALTSNTGTGGIAVWSAVNVTIKNNLIWGNLPSTQIKLISSSANATYNNIQGGYTGAGNIDLDPVLNPACFMINSISPCVDAGDTSSIFNDLNIGNAAIFPSLGTSRNDMGAFGGPFAKITGCSQTAIGIGELTEESVFLSVYPNPFTFQSTVQTSKQLTNAILKVSSLLGSTIRIVEHINGQYITLSRDHLPAGIYFLQLMQDDKLIATSKLMISD